MTELNDAHHNEAAQPTPQWPETAEAAGPALSDPSVAAIVAGLDGVPGLPVNEHEAVYGELHDALLEALNEDTASGEGEA